MEDSRSSRSRYSSALLLILIAGCATPAAPTSPQEAYNQAVQKCEQARTASLGQPPGAVEAAFNSCMAQAASVGPK